MDMSAGHDLGRAGPARTRDEYFERWSVLHGGVDPYRSAPIRGWLSLSYTLARPLARLRVRANAVTIFGLLIAITVPVAAAASSGWWLVAAAALAVLSGLLDGVDGAVAVISGRTTRWGFVLDSVADRISDGLLFLALWAAGASTWVCVAVAAVTFLQEYVRARAAAAGLREVGVITIWERPSRITVTAVFLVLAAVAPYSGARVAWADRGAWLGMIMGVVGLAQVLITVRRKIS